MSLLCATPDCLSAHPASCPVRATLLVACSFFARLFRLSLCPSLSLSLSLCARLALSFSLLSSLLFRCVCHHHHHLSLSHSLFLSSSFLFFLVFLFAPAPFKYYGACGNLAASGDGDTASAATPAVPRHLGGVRSPNPSSGIEFSRKPSQSSRRNGETLEVAGKAFMRI